MAIPWITPLLDQMNQFVISHSSSYELTRFVLLRLLGLVYFFAFLSLVKQLAPLLGEQGLTPATRYLETIEFWARSKRKAFWKLPSIFWLYCSDHFMKALAWIGLLLSITLIVGFANVPILFLLWAIYLSFVHIGQVWYGYGWESQLLETGFLAMFLVPLLDPHPFPSILTPIPIIWLFWWLTFRLYLGAGLIKLRADKCWRNLTCLWYHFETQPIPNPLSRYFHFLPKVILRFGTAWNHIVELVAPFFLFWPQQGRIIAGLLVISFQVILILSGNLSFLNWITIVAGAASLDDSVLQHVLPNIVVEKAHAAAALAEPTIPLISWVILVIFAMLSIPVVRNLFSHYQAMNTSFNQFHLVNTYGAFGTVGRQRHELIIEGTADKTVTEKTAWKEYEIPYKPGDPKQHLPIIAPYQPRLSWQMWFAAMSHPAREEWLIRLVKLLLENDKTALKLIKKNPFPNQPPQFIRISLYHYQFAKPGSPGSGQVWVRGRIGTWLAAVEGRKDY
ncbi:lipase maturation factor family protein [Candidatus Woesearchaeota archaeon]|nr:lipase maturation factor family protein [Candidatus Woesearchaeota archaeon]